MDVTIAEVETLEELKALSWVESIKELMGFHPLAVSKDGLMLLSMHHHDEKYQGCRTRYVLGFFLDGPCEFDLPKVGDLMGRHLEGCANLQLEDKDWY